MHHQHGKPNQMCDAFRPTLFKCRSLGAADGDPLLLHAPFVVTLLTVLQRGKERPSLTVGHAPMLLAITGPEDADLPGLYWLGSQLAVAALAPCQLSHSGPRRPFIKSFEDC